jgi:hypothetical protein
MELVMDVKLAQMAFLLVKRKPVSLSALNKLLFLVDVSYFIGPGKKARKLSNSDYIKHEAGPIPENMEGIQSALLKTGLIRVSADITGNYLRQTLTFEAPADGGFLTRVEDELDLSEKKIISRISDDFGGKSAIELAKMIQKCEFWRRMRRSAKVDFFQAASDPAFQTLVEGSLAQAA